MKMHIHVAENGSFYSVKNIFTELVLQFCDKISFLFVFFSKSQQYKLAKYCEDVFGDWLLKRALDDVPVGGKSQEPFKVLPYIYHFYLSMFLHWSDFYAKV